MTGITDCGLPISSREVQLQHLPRGQWIDRAIALEAIDNDGLIDAHGQQLPPLRRIERDVKAERRMRREGEARRLKGEP